MSLEQSKHLRIGSLVALSEFENGVAETFQHIESCSGCSTLYNFLAKYGKAARESKSEILAECPKSDMDEVAFFLTFLSNGLPEEQAARFLNHINNCFFCFQVFITNWSSYLQGRKNEKLRTANKEKEGIT